MKYNELGEVIKERGLHESFGFIKENKVALAKQCRAEESLDQSRMNVLQKELDANIVAF